MYYTCMYMHINTTCACMYHTDVTHALHPHTYTLQAHICVTTDVTHSRARAYTCTLNIHAYITQLLCTYYTHVHAHMHYTCMHVSHRCDMCLHARAYATCTCMYHRDTTPVLHLCTYTYIPTCTYHTQR